MVNAEKYAQIDDYLDLFLYAGKLHDWQWQDEIKAKLIYLQQNKDDDQKRERDLQHQFIEVNRQILMLYRQVRCHATELSGPVKNRLIALKQRRLELGREIDALKNRREHIFR